MNEREKEHKEKLKKREQKTAGQNAGMTKAAGQNRTSSRPGRYLSQRRKTAKIRRQKKRLIAAVSAPAAVLLILLVVLICKNGSGKNNPAVLQGVWHYDQYTEYEFDGKGNGCMRLDKNSCFDFSYRVDGKTVQLDFALDYVTDCEYTFQVNGNQLTLMGGNGTAEPGETYALIKQSE